jgi:hypothetical protein
MIYKDGQTIYTHVFLLKKKYCSRESNQWAYEQYKETTQSWIEVCRKEDSLDFDISSSNRKIFLT